MAEQRYRIASSPIIYEILDNEVVILNLEMGVYYNLNGSGTEIWRLIQQGASLQEMIDSYECPDGADEIREGIEGFLAELLDEKIIFLTEQAGEAPFEKNRPFQRPLLHRYHDMKELLLLDPIHEVDPLGWPAVR